MLDGLLIEQARADPDLTGMLAEYCCKPAFFYQKSPPDTASGWNSKSQYPRVDYNVDMRHDPERKSAGTLSINVWCSAQSEYMPEDIEKRIISLIDGTFYTESGSDTVCAVWNSSEAFDYTEGNTQDRRDPEIFGVTIMFDLLTFPSQLTTDPDPIEGLVAFTKREFTELAVISVDNLPPVWKPTDKTPAIYWRFIGTTAAAQSYSVSWFNGTFAAHIIAQSVAERNRWIKAIAEQMQADGEVVLFDGSPMFLNRLEIRHDADSLREGQLALTAQYGVLTARAKMLAQIPVNKSTILFAKEEKLNGKN